MYHLFLGSSLGLKENLQKTQGLYISIVSKTWLGAASRKVASLVWKDRLPYFSRLSGSELKASYGVWLAAQKGKGKSERGRASEWWDKAKRSSHKTAGLHSSVHAGPLQQMLTLYNSFGTVWCWIAATWFSRSAKTLRKPLCNHILTQKKSVSVSLKASSR